MTKLEQIMKALEAKKAEKAAEKAKKQEVVAKYKGKEKGKPLSTTDRIARIEEILEIE